MTDQKQCCSHTPHTMGNHSDTFGGAGDSDPCYCEEELCKCSCHTPPNSMEERFKQKFCQTSSWEGIGLVLREDTPDGVINFIQNEITTALAKERERVLGIIEGERRDCPHDSRSHCMEEMCWIHEEGGYNSAVDTIKNKIEGEV